MDVEFLKVVAVGEVAIVQFVRKVKLHAGYGFKELLHLKVDHLRQVVLVTVRNI